MRRTDGGHRAKYIDSSLVEILLTTSFNFHLPSILVPSPHFDVEVALGHSGVGVNLEKAASQAFWHPPQIPPRSFTYRCATYYSWTPFLSNGVICIGFEP